MRKKQNRIFGQATIEMALLLPVAMFLLYWVTQGFKVNQQASDQSIRLHTQDLTAFNHGNGTIMIDGVPRPTSVLDTLPPLGSGDILDAVKRHIADNFARWGLTELLSDIPFLNDDTWYSAGAKGFALGAGNSFIGSGFKQVDWEQAARSGASGTVQSGDVTTLLRGNELDQGGLQEFLGSGAQTGLNTYTQTSDGKSILTSSAGGLLGSNASNNFFKDGDEVLKGAARGAVQSTLTGMINNDGKVKFGDVAVASGLGAFRTDTVAGALTGGNSYKQNAAAFQAANAALSAVASGKNVGEALYSASGAALFSGESMKEMIGESGWSAAGVGTAYGATTALLRGEDGRAVGLSAIESMGTSFASQGGHEVIVHGLSAAFSAAKSGENVGEVLKNGSIGFGVSVVSQELMEGTKSVFEGWKDGITDKKTVGENDEPQPENAGNRP